MTPITWQAAVDDEEQRPLLQDILEAAVDDRRQAAVDVEEQRPKLLLMTNTKSHTSFRLVAKSTTLDDLERQIRTLLQKRCLSEPPQKFE